MNRRPALAILLCAVLSFANAEANPVFGVKTGIAYLYSLSDVMQVPINDPLVANLFSRIKSRLPINGNFSELSEPVLFGIVSLGAQFCSRMVDFEMLKPNIYSRLMTKGISFSRGPKNVGTESRIQMIRDHAAVFWGRMPTDGELQVFLDFLEESANALPDEGKSTQAWVVATCTQFATSLEFLLN